jgi:hypothetical protein
MPTNPFSIFPPLATEAAKNRLILNCLDPIHGQSTRNRFCHFHWRPFCILLLTSQKRKNFIGSRQRQLGAVHDVPVYPFVQGLSSTIFVSASFLRFMALCFDKANVCHRHDKNDTGDVCF